MAFFFGLIREDPVRHSRIYEQYGDDTKGEEIYQDLCSLQARTAFEVSMLFFFASLVICSCCCCCFVFDLFFDRDEKFVKFQLTQTPTLEKRDFVIKELIDTERNYVDVLFKLKKNFMKPLQGVLDEESHGIVFYKVTVSVIELFLQEKRIVLNLFFFSIRSYMRSIVVF